MRRTLLSVTSGLVVAGTTFWLVPRGANADEEQPAACPLPRPGVPRWNEAGPINIHRNLRFTVEVGGVPLVYDSANPAITPYGGPGWALGVGTLADDGAAVTVDDAGVRAVFTAGAGGLYTGERFELRTLVRTAADRFELRHDGGFVRVFAGGREIEWRDRHGVARVFTYDVEGRLLEMRDPRADQAATLSYADGRLSAVTLDGLDQLLTYDGYQRLAAIGSATTGMPMPIASFQYGDGDRLVTTTNRAGETTWYEYADDGGYTGVRLPDSLAVRQDCARDAQGRLIIRMTDSFGDRVAQVHDAEGSVVAVRDLHGNETTVTRDAAARVTAVTTDGDTTSYAWSPGDDLLSVTDPSGQSRSFEYDGAHRVIRSTDPLGRVSTVAYDGHGLPIQTTDVYGRTTYLDRETDGDVWRVRTPDGLATSYQRDALGRPTAITAPDGLITSYAYTATGELASVQYPDGTGESWTFTSDGRPLTHTDRRGRLTSAEYDGERRASRLALPGGKSIDVGYDWAGRVSEQTTRLGPETKLESVSYGMYGEVATRALNGVLSQAAPRTHVPLPMPPMSEPFVGGEGEGEGEGEGSGTGEPPPEEEPGEPEAPEEPGPGSGEE